MLLKNGYLRAGYDHFIKKTDYLAEQIKNKKAGWDRLGVVSGQYNGILGAGVSSVGKLNGKLYYQNTFENIEYERLINLERLPVSNFHLVSKKDQITEYVIKNLRQYFYINKKDVNSKFNLEFDDFFKKPINLLKEFEQDNLLINNENYIKIKKTGEIYSNLIASKFDYFINN
jgi:oxygen-independent coproporphyrinogen-3 oxidase